MKMIFIENFRELLLLLLFAIRLEHFQVPIPYFSLKDKELKIVKAPLFGQFPVFLLRDFCLQKKGLFFSIYWPLESLGLFAG